MALSQLWFFVPEAERFMAAYYAPLGLLAIGASLAAGFALVHRIRAGAIASVIAGLALIIEWGRQYYFGHFGSDYFNRTLALEVGSGVCCLLAAAIAWRGVRGSMRGWGRAVAG